MTSDSCNVYGCVSHRRSDVHHTSSSSQQTADGLGMTPIRSNMDSSKTILVETRCLRILSQTSVNKG
eukprot:CAMPEP_0204277214 /NCGR_PEP_ID=MMETSP0468-20130131/29168_1 /ASSEMBLY_ACC=CAM_ASM_000383 /TAXON_ID=2969 /ORGANISM="Oxyrrhis marina" /LENGTH=66 /DNA_ID=CAMNT_0051253953 /DNA_START=986 /DNA_END=1186 /DNA_ORIENTATION=+